MSQNKKLKKAIRERMKRTGERYTTARMHVIAKRRAVDDLVDDVGVTLSPAEGFLGGEPMDDDLMNRLNRGDP